MSQQKTYGMPLKRARSVQEGSLVSVNDLQLFRPRSTSSNGRTKFDRLISLSTSASPPVGSKSQSPTPTSPFVNKTRDTSPIKRAVSTYGASSSSLTHSPVLKRSSSLGSPPPSAGKPAKTPTATFNSTSKPRQIQLDDPFADPFADDTPAVATQPVDDESDEGAPQATYGRSASVSAASAAPTSSSWSGSSTEKADEIRFTIDGLHSSNTSAIRASSSHKLLELLLSDTKNGLSILRAGNGFASMTDAMPPVSQLHTSDYQILVTLFVAVSFIASSDVTNATFFNAKGIDILYAVAFPAAVRSTHAKATTEPSSSQASEDMDDELDNGINSNSIKDGSIITKADVASAFGGIRKSKKRVSKNSTSPSQLLELLQAQQRELMEVLSKTDNVPINELHIESVVRLDYLALLTLTAFSEDAQFVQYFIASSNLGSSRAHLQLILEQMKQSHENLTFIHCKDESKYWKAGKGKGKKASSSRFAHSSEYFLEQHRLQCLLTILENVTHHHASYFEQVCTISLKDRTLEEEMEEGEEEGANAEVAEEDAKRTKPSDAVQLFFLIIDSFMPNIDAHQLGEKSESSPDAAHLDLLPSTAPNSILPLFHILRLLVNVTNRNEVGVNVINAQYQKSKDGGEKVCGLQLLLNLIGRIQWSYFSEISGQPDMFNLMSVSLPIIVNSVEVSQLSKKLLDEQCTVVMEKVNVKLAKEAGFSVSSTGVSTLPALEFVCMLWKFLHQQLEKITQAYLEKEKAKEEERKQNGVNETQETEMDMTLEQQISDPFAAAAKRAASAVDTSSKKNSTCSSSQRGSDVGAPASALEAHLFAQIEQADAEEEEVSLGFRTLASMSSLLLGFFACTSVEYRRRILRSLGMTNFAPMLRYIQEFLFLQSDSQLLQQEGLETSFRMLETLKKADKRSENSNGNDDDEPWDSSSSSEPVLKKQKVEVRKSASPPVSNPSSSPTLSTFDALFQRQAKMRK